MLVSRGSLARDLTRVRYTERDVFYQERYTRGTVLPRPGFLFIAGRTQCDRDLAGAGMPDQLPGRSR
jgi:hypothetical protein